VDLNGCSHTPITRVYIPYHTISLLLGNIEFSPLAGGGNGNWFHLLFICFGIPDLGWYVNETISSWGLMQSKKCSNRVLTLAVKQLICRNLGFSELGFRSSMVYSNCRVCVLFGKSSKVAKDEAMSYAVLPCQPVVATHNCSPDSFQLGIELINKPSTKSSTYHRHSARTTK
jgi:hypothetical protein